MCPLRGISASSFPAEVPLSVFARLTDARGRYAVGLQLVDSDGQVVWTWEKAGVVAEPDPLSAHLVNFPNVMVRFPQAGRYDLMFLIDGEALAHHALGAREMPSP